MPSKPMAGISKTAFARHAAPALAPRYPDAAIWVDLYGHTPGMTPREPCGAWAEHASQSTHHKDMVRSGTPHKFPAPELYAGDGPVALFLYDAQDDQSSDLGVNT